MSFDRERVPIDMHDEQAFSERVEPHRRELQLHCYRMLGSLQDAEDALQETLMSAWRGLEGFQEKSSLRTWLYRIATNRCLNTLRDRGRRPSPGLPFVPPPPTRMEEMTWLEPYPDDLLPDTEPGPESRYELREGVGLAFITALQRLPVTQRTTLVLRDVLGFRATEVADILDTTEATVNSALQRARGAGCPNAARSRARATPWLATGAAAGGGVRGCVRAGRHGPSRLAALRGGVGDHAARAARVPGSCGDRGVPGSCAGLPPGRRPCPARADTRQRGARVRPLHRGGAGQRHRARTGRFALVLEGERIRRLTRFGAPELLPQFGLPLDLQLD